jgi:hypothetical protein
MKTSFAARKFELCFRRNVVGKAVGHPEDSLRGKLGWRRARRTAFTPGGRGNRAKNRRAPSCCWRLVHWIGQAGQGGRSRIDGQGEADSAADR